MAIDIAVLATTVVTSFLMPYAKAGLEKIAEGVTKEVGKKAAEYATDLTEKVWNQVKGVFSSPKEQTTLELFQENPGEMKAMLVKALQEKLEQDPDLAQTLAELIDSPGPDGDNTGAQIMNAGIAGIADLRGADLSGAKGVTVGGVIINRKGDADSDG